MIPWKTIADEYLQQEFTCLESLLHEYHPTVLDRLDHLFDKATRHQGDEDDLGLFEAYKSISSTLDGPLVLALYLYSICRDEWERTDSFASIRKVIRVHESLLERILKLISDPVEAKITHVILRHISSLDGCMSAESALNASSPTGMIEAAEKVLNVVNEVLRLSENLEPRYCTIGEAIRRDALASRCYFQAIRLVATAVEAFNVKANYASTRLKEAIAAVRAAENDPVLREDFYSTELEAHRAALEVMLSRLDFPRVHEEMATVQSNLALLRSSAICHTAVHRDFLDRLYTMAGLERIEQDYDRDCSVADAVFQEVGELDRLVRERHERFVQAEEARERRKIELILSLVAIASVADVFNLINSAFGAKDWILYEVAAIGVMALSTVGLFWKLNRLLPGYFLYKTRRAGAYDAVFSAVS